MPQFSLDFDLDSEHGLDAAPAERPASIGYGIAGLEEGTGTADGQGIALVVDAEVWKHLQHFLSDSLSVRSGGDLALLHMRVPTPAGLSSRPISYVMNWTARVLMLWQDELMYASQHYFVRGSEDQAQHMQVTSYLMMGALSPGLKRHSVTLFEGDSCWCPHFPACLPAAILPPSSFNQPPYLRRLCSRERKVSKGPLRAGVT